MRILITGANGLLGQKLVSLIVSTGKHELIATGKGGNRNPTLSGSYKYVSMDITSKNSIDDVFSKYRPEMVIHTAAMTNVDECENNHEGCWELNVDAVQHLIDACEEQDSFLLHLSTDFIFDGEAGPYDESATPNPISYYGESKLASEQLIQKSNLSWAIARTVLVYGIAHDMSRSNIILWVKNSLEQHKDIHVVNDQWRTPTLAEDLAMGCYLIAAKKATGIFNISGSDFLNPYQMAMQTAEFFDLDKKYIHETDGSRFTQDAKRPPKTGFIIKKAQETLGYTPHSFADGIGILDEQISQRSQ